MSRLRSYDTVLGMNGRNDRIAKANTPAAMRLVDDKAATKQALTAHGIPTAPTLHHFTSRRHLRDVDWSLFPSSWALKPNKSLGGNGILLATGARGDAWHSGSGRTIAVHAVADHVRMILAGDFSPAGHDTALLEPLIRTHPDLARISHQGLPDIRIICHEDRPALAMVRLPTSTSGGRANLHQGAIGAAVDLATGTVTAARLRQAEVVDHPDTGERLVGAVLPHWQEIVEAARRCSRATGLRYLGADIVVDVDRGPLVLEVNARPGLQIQNVTGRGLVRLASRARRPAAPSPVRAVSPLRQPQVVRPGALVTS